MSNVKLSENSAGNLKPATRYLSETLHEAVKLRVGEPGMLDVAPQTLPDFFAEVCQKNPEAAALVYETPGAGVDGWTTLTYKDYAAKVRQAALLLMHVGLEPRTSVGILAFNCPEWFYSELGALQAGGILAGIYPSNSAEAVHHVLSTSEATVCVVDDAQQMAKVRSIKDRLPRLKGIIQLNGPFEPYVGTEPAYYRWADLELLQLEEQLGAELQLRQAEVHANECAMLIFTSGTVGMPKAVMLSHDAIVYNTKAITDTFGGVEYGRESVVSYLPLNHIAAQIFDIFCAMDFVGCVYFADRNALKGTLMRTLKKAQPTRMFGVPRVYEKIQEQLLKAEAGAKPLSRLLLSRARTAVEQYLLTCIEGKQASFFQNIKYWLGTKITGSIKQALGFANCKTFVIGGAPVTAKLKHYFLGLDMQLAEAYGMSESGAITLHTKINNLYSSGCAIKGFHLRIDKPDANGEGEICVRGRSNLMGYLNQPDKTREVLSEDGWLSSGDLGHLDDRGNLIISGRLKELIITAGGENIPPVHIEELIKFELPCVSNAMVVGDHRKYLIVLLTLKTETNAQTGLPLDALRPELIGWLLSLDLSYTCLSDLLNIPADLQLPRDASDVPISAEPKLWQAIEQGIGRVNQKAISNAQKVQKFAILPHDFSIPTGELGPTLKMRRNIVHAKYAAVIERLYK